MKINTSLILCAGYGKRLNPITLETPKPLLKIRDLTILEKCINLNIKLGMKNIFINTFYLKEQIFDFIKKKSFPINIEIINDGKKILDTGGGVLNMINNSQAEDCMVFNPDTLWSENYAEEINKMIDFYLENKIGNILLVVNKNLSFDKNLNGDFNLVGNHLKKSENKKFIYTGCQILNKKLFENYKIENFSISRIWNELLAQDKLNGFESLNKFYHLTNLETFKKLADS